MKFSNKTVLNFSVQINDKNLLELLVDEYLFFLSRSSVESLLQEKTVHPVSRKGGTLLGDEVWLCSREGRLNYWVEQEMTHFAFGDNQFRSLLDYLQKSLGLFLVEIAP